MKNTLFSIAVVISSCTFAQTNELYHIYKFNGKAGVTDTLNNNKLPADYEWYIEELYGKMKWIFENENQTTIFDRENGTNEYVKEISTYRLMYKNEMYMQITKDGKDYLLSHHSNTRFDLPKGREHIKTVGDYFYVTETIYPESKSYRDKKTGKLMPPKRKEPQNQFRFFKNPSDAKPILEILAKELEPLWKYNEYITNLSENFDYLVFTTDKEIKIYDSHLKFIRTIAKRNEEYLDLGNLVSEALNQKVEQRGVSPTMPVTEPVVYPQMVIYKQGTQKQVVIEKKYADQNPLALFTTQDDVRVRGNTVTLRKQNSNYAEFDVNLNSGQIYYPKMYKEQLDLDFSAKEAILVSDDHKYEGEILERVDEPAVFMGGEKALFKFINDNLQYPMEAMETGISGKVIAKFIVEKDGSISSIKIVRSLSKECDAEVIRILKKMPQWKPAMLNDKVVRSYYNIPINFVATE